MSLLSLVESGPKDTPHFTVLYGVSGIGKTTFASKAPSPLFLDIEGGSEQLNVKRLQHSMFPTFEPLSNVVDELLKNPGEFKTIVIDSITALEKLIEGSVCAENKVKAINEIPYGGGSVAVITRLNEFLTKLKALPKAGMNVLMLGHAQTKSFTDPSLNTTFDRIVIQANTKFSQAIMAAADNVFFAKFSVDTEIDKRTKKVQAFSNGDRIIFTEYRAAFDAKNRYSLPFELPMDYEALSQAIKEAKPKSSSQLKSDIADLLVAADSSTREKAEAALLKAGDDATALSRIKRKLIEVQSATSNANAS